MKYVIVLPDGAADEKLEVLGGCTPLEAACIPHMDWVAQHGCIGRTVTVLEGYVPATDVATLSLFGYDPAIYYTGRAPLEGAARGLAVGADDYIFRCNFMTIDAVTGCLVDFTADHISQEDADLLICDLNKVFEAEGYKFHSGVSYRNLMVAQGVAGFDRFEGMVSQAPHDIPGRLISDYMPRGNGAEEICNLMRRAAKEVLVDHPVNQKRLERGELLVTDIWLWGQGKSVTLEPFVEKFGLGAGCRCAVITGVDIIRGLAVCMGMDLIEVEGATGYLDTDYAGKGRAAVKALCEDGYDLVVVHIEAPDEAGHEGDVKAKIEALEKIDELIVGPLLEVLRSGKLGNEWRILVAPDHPTPCTTMAHSGEAPPFCYAGSSSVELSDDSSVLGFSEVAAVGSGLLFDPGFSGLMKGFILGR